MDDNTESVNPMQAPMFEYGEHEAPPQTAPPQRRRKKKLFATAVAVGAVAVAGAGAGIGHLTWGSPQTPQVVSHDSITAKQAPGNVSSGSGGSSYANGGNWPGYSSGSGSSGGYGSSGGAGSSGGYGSSGGAGSSGSSNTGESSASNATGGPSNASSIATDVDAGLVDINTNLSYQDEEAAGTGMVLTSNGEVLTNNHVIEDATSISVTDIGNGKTYAATVVGYDRTADVAVLQLTDASGLKTVSIGNSSAVTVDEAVVGIGNAGGVGGTPSYAGGEVTTVGQSITASDSGSGTTENLTGLIGTNADIEPGDSGGPLVNSSGQVIGMDTAGSSSSGGFGFEPSQSSTTDGFAIPINTALSVAKKIEKGTSSSSVHIGATAFIGVEVESSSQSGSSGFGFGNAGGFGEFGGNSGNSGTSGTATQGAVIAQVISASPAASAGLASGDVITSINGTTVTSPTTLASLLQSKAPGQTISVGYVNAEGAQSTTSVHLVSGPPQ